MHSKVECASEEERVKLGVGSTVKCGLGPPLGPPIIAVLGRTVSTVKLRADGVGSMLEAASMARTRKVWGPSGSGLYDFGELQGA